MAQQLTATGQMVLLFVHQLVLPAITCLLALIINPTCKNFVITPICPHSLTARSIVLAKEDVVTVEVEQIRSNIKEEAIISFDGREGLSIVRRSGKDI